MVPAVSVANEFAAQLSYTWSAFAVAIIIPSPSPDKPVKIFYG